MSLNKAPRMDLFWVNKSFSYSFLFTLQMSSTLAKYFFILFSLAGWGGEEVEVGGGVEAKQKDGIEGVGDRARVGEGRKAP